MYLYRPNRISDLWFLLLHEKECQAEKEIYRARVENCLGYIADMCWAIVSERRIKTEIEPYTVLIAKAKAQKPQQEEDFYTILKNRVENRRKGGDPA